MDDFSTYVSGGAGILLSAPAATLLSPAVLTPEASCAPLAKQRLNDVLLSACAWALGVPLVHANQLQPEFDTGSMDDYRVRASVAEIGAVASMHR